jgi:hypothetical protein
MQIETYSEATIVRDGEDEAVEIRPIVRSLKLARGAVKCGYCDKVITGFAVRFAVDGPEIECASCYRRLGTLELGVDTRDL